MPPSRDLDRLLEAFDRHGRADAFARQNAEDPADMKPRAWSAEDEAFLRNHYRNGMSAAEIAVALKRTKVATKARAQVLGLARSRKYPDNVIETVREMYPTTLATEIAAQLGRSVNYVYRVANSIGVRKDPTVRDEQQKAFFKKLAESGKSHRYPKGHVPANKGLRRPGWSPGRMKETQFKKGQFSPNRRDIGSERVSKDGYLYVKIADFQANRNWKMKHVIVWEEHNGPLPEAMNIIFKDGDKRNFDISNLEAISNEELMRRNTLHNLPEPVKSMIHQLIGFRRKLNSYAKKQDRRSQEHSV
jgi:hypothetical protein